MNIPFTQVDAFTVDDRPLTGNPAAVMLLDDWLEDEVLQAIAVENNLSETAFLRPSDGPSDYDLRWFTPGCEVDLCGHATIASGHVVIGDSERVTFATRSGQLSVERRGDRLLLDLPAARATNPHRMPDIVTALGVEPAETLLATSAEDALLIVLDDEAQVRACRPDFGRLREVPQLIIVTAPGTGCDVASRVFAPGFGIDEDPVTGAAHAAMAPYWAKRLGSDRFSAFQASARGGQLDCQLSGDRLALSGRCRTVIEGRFLL
ncbi:PhzF family phenazine biosynthesis protein [Sphingomicrobium lutaoense]|uniref:PhzF family phenazine biosynthesis protein n=1 Tax=Sphingomicrobium lutaoense TaxID=515949 RepID=A0A839Z0L8_9SPHN|nr:PhzF family phenazine biosynthesis protein [Sphingomicrobium lutaoense]MBB3763105.1 PhzF family phenazine biosynthesis protein [Sphingomicrobium lutaoense]